MTLNLSFSKLGLVVSIIVAISLFLPTNTYAADVTADCSGATPGAFTSIQAAIDSLDMIGPHAITVVGGPCTENLTIVNRDRLTIDASPFGAFVLSAVGTDDNVIQISGSRAIRLIQIGASGGRNGVRIDRQSEVSLEGVTLSDNAVDGVSVEEHSALTINGLVQNNGQVGIRINRNSYGLVSVDTRSNGLDGIRCANGSHCIVDGVTSENNGSAGLSLTTGATTDAQTFGGTSNIFQGNVVGVFVVRNSVVRFFGDSGTMNIIRNNTGGGIQVYVNSDALLFGGSVSVNGNGQGMFVGENSMGEFASGNTFSGNGAVAVACDTTSLLAGDLSGINPIKCTQIERALGPPRPGAVR